MDNNIGALGFFAFTAAVLLVPAWLRSRARIAALGLIREAMANGRALDAALVEKLMPSPEGASSPRWFGLLCLFMGVPSLALGAALALGAGLVPAGSNSSPGELMVGALICGCTGIGFTALGVAVLRLFRANASFATWFVLACLFMGVSGLSTGVALGLAIQLGLAGALVNTSAGTNASPGEVVLGALVCGASGVGFLALAALSRALLGRDDV